MNKCGHKVKFNRCGYLVKFKQYGKYVKTILCCYLVKIN